MKKNRNEIDWLGLLGFIMLVVVILFLACCKSPRVVVSDARMTIKDGKVTVERTGPAEVLRDTIIIGKFITRMK